MFLFQLSPCDVNTQAHIPSNICNVLKINVIFSPGVIETELQRRAGLNDEAYKLVIILR